MDNLSLTLLRLAIGALIFRWPLPALIASLYIDASDWHFYEFNVAEDYARYQLWDKVLDTYYLGIAFLTTLFWRDLKAKAVSVFLFLYRAVGVGIFALTSNSAFLFFFPNVFENFFIFYLVYKMVVKNDRLFLPGEKGILFLIIIALPKIFQEYLLHYADITPSELLGLDNVSSFWLLFSIIMSMYILVLLWRIKKVQGAPRIRYV